MFKNTLQNKDTRPIRQKSGGFLLAQADTYLSGLDKQLSKQIDKRLARTFFDLFVAILCFRNRPMGLLLSELGGFIAGFGSAPAGTKRISNLLRCGKWGHDLIDRFFLDRGRARVRELQVKGKRPLLLWDDSRVEKPESWFLQGLCSVFSSKGQRLTKVKRGFYRPPASRICVPGYKWTALTLSALGDVPSVFHMAWWTTRGVFKEHGTNIVYRMLRKIKEEIGRAALNVLDRGYANTDMLGWLTDFGQDFLLRWKKNQLLLNGKGEAKKPHLIARSHKGRHGRIVWDKERKKSKHVTVSWVPVRHPELPDEQLYMVVARDKNNHNGPMYLLTNLPVTDSASAWEMVSSYMHRWEVEQAFRCCKSELAMESPRLWFFRNTLKLLGIVSLAYDFLLRMLRDWKAWSAQLLANWCHRTGNRYRLARVPVYRLRSAISMCLLALFFEKLFERKGLFDSVT